MIGQQAAAKLAGGEWSFKPDPTRSGFGQAAIGVPGALWGAGVRSCTWEACEVAHVGNYGIELSQGCHKNRIWRCRLTDLGAGGVKIGEVAIRDPDSEQTFGNELSDCTITDGGNLFPSCRRRSGSASRTTTPSPTTTSTTSTTRPSRSAGPGATRTAARHNVVEYNHIHHIGMSDGQPPILSDMGGIYTLGVQAGHA